MNNVFVFLFAFLQKETKKLRRWRLPCAFLFTSCAFPLANGLCLFFFFALMQKRNKKNQGCGKMAKNCAGCLARGETRFLLTLLIADTTGSNNPRLPLPQAAKRLPAQFS
ncbi:MAG: hypothetical protein EOO10_19540 [Chitinophagaceae bacterium]|nr:MAG: hypothetical protein EOO10_19540 [Chitinophagaceae bacterium]